MNLPHNHRLQLGHLDAVREARRERERELAEAEKTKDEHGRSCNCGCDCCCCCGCCDGPDKGTDGTP